MGEIIKISEIRDIKISYDLSVEHKMAYEDNKNKIKRFEPDNEYIFRNDTSDIEIEYNPRKLNFFYPERPLKFHPEIDYIILNNPAWIAQPKYNGWRIIIIHDIDGIKFFSRKGKQHKINIDIDIPEGCMLDCELIALDEKMPSTHNKVSSFIKKNPDKLQFVVFDIMYVNYKPILYNPYISRLTILDEIIEEGEKIKIIRPVNKDIETFKLLIENGFEGIVFKNLYDMYEMDGGNWLKCKSIEDLEHAWNILKFKNHKII